MTADPLRETSHQMYLRLLARLKRRSQALVHYEYVRQLLQNELGVEPLAETQVLVEAIRREAQTAPDAPPVVEHTRFVGRTHEREAGIDRIEHAMAGQGGILCLEGEAGIGKSRLWRELASSARWRGVVTAYGGASETPGGSPFSPLADALHLLLSGARASQLESVLSVETLAVMGVLYAPWQNRTIPPELPPAQARLRLQHNFVTLMQTLSRFAPLVLMLDDLHWAEAALWDLLDALAPHLANVPLLLCLAYRRPEIEKNSGWELLRKWERAGVVQTIALGSLDAQEVSHLLPQTERADAARVIALTGGNPFYISEYLTERAEGHAFKQNSLTARIGALSDAARAALDAAAVLGEQVAFRLWTTVLQASPLALAALGEELTARSVLQPTPAGYAFVYDIVRAVVYENIEPTRRAALHSRAADTFAALEPDNWRARAFQLERAERTKEAADAYRQVGAQDLAQLALRDAQTAFANALTLMPSEPSIAYIETALALAQVSNALGDRAQEERASNEALRGARTSDDAPLLLQALVSSGRHARQRERARDRRRRNG